jgi:adenylate cyclase
MTTGRRERVERRLAAILAADVAGYSRLMGENEEGTLAALKAIRRELGDTKIAEHHGRIVKTTGDGVLAEFPSVVDAVRCAVEIQRGMAERNAAVPAEKRIEFRIGVNLGDIILDDGDIFGDGVNIAARVEGLAAPGGICIASSAHEQVRDKLDLAFEDMGEQQVKNIARPVRVYRVRTESPLPNPPPQSPDQVRGGEGRVGVLPLPDKPSIAVLPFANLSGDPEQEYFADGMVEEIITALSQIRWLFVIARNSSFTYKRRAVDVKQVGRELGVRYVLEGSVRKAGNRVRITGQLIDTVTGAHIWADRFDGTLDDIFELQDRVASSVVGAIEPRLRFAEMDRAGRKPTGNLDAYDVYLRALAQGYKRTKEGLAESIGLLHRALEFDPEYPLVMARIGAWRGFQRSRGWIPPGGPEVEEGIRLARQALAAARDDPEVLELAGNVHAQLADENETALGAIEQAISLNPNLALAFAHRALVLNRLGRHDEAIIAAQQAMRLSPQDPAAYVSYQAMAIAHLAAGRYEEGLPWALRAVRDNAGAVALRLKLSLCGHLGRLEEARESLRLLREIEIPSRRLLQQVGTAGVPPNSPPAYAKACARRGCPRNECDPPPRRDPCRRFGGVLAADGAGRGADARTPQGAAARAFRSEDPRAP